MKKKIDHIEFRLLRIVTEQFATIEENYTGNDKIVGLGINLKYGIDIANKAITVLAEIKIEEDNKAFIKLEAGCVFAIEPKKWAQLINEEEKTFKAPKGFIQHLSVLVVGTCRGILHAKTEGTAFNQFFLPTVNVIELVKEDLKITL